MCFTVAAPEIVPNLVPELAGLAIWPSNKGLDCVYDTNAVPVATTEDGRVAGHDLSRNEVQTRSRPVSLSNEDMTETLDDWCEFDAVSDIAGEAQTTVDWGAFELTTNQFLSNTPEDSLLQLPRPDIDCLSRSGSLVDNSPYSSYGGDGFVATCDPQRLLACDSASSQLSLVLQDEEQVPALVRTTHISEPPDTSFLSQISMSDPVANCTANVVMRMLRAFPQMMLRRETFPPFIHAHWHRSSHADAAEPALPMPLVNCMGIAQVFASPNLETRPFLWRSIQMEQRSAAEKSKKGIISKQELIATIQAQLIYIMMRVIDKSPAIPGMNLEMLVIYQIGVRCDSFDGFREVPLPASKSLWDAKTRQGWQTEYEIYETSPRGELELFGDLIDACKQSGEAPSQLKLDVWNSTVDGLGIMLSLAASIF
ncbi:hypothetical protein PG984_010158 [Apiospora sp. TS-2023a]